MQALHLDNALLHATRGDNEGDESLLMGNALVDMYATSKTTTSLCTFTILRNRRVVNHLLSQSQRARGHFIHSHIGTTRGLRLTSRSYTNFAGMVCGGEGSDLREYGEIEREQHRYVVPLAHHGPSRWECYDNVAYMRTYSETSPGLKINGQKV